MPKTIKYKALWAWDTMMGSHNYYKEIQQDKAAKLNASEDVIYFTKDKAGKDTIPRQLKDVLNFSIKAEIEEAIKKL